MLKLIVKLKGHFYFKFRVKSWGRGPSLKVGGGGMSAVAPSFHMTLCIYSLFTVLHFLIVKFTSLNGLLW